jgi:LPXTG-site transpeptidase (sortase) family protein
MAAEHNRRNWRTAARSAFAAAARGDNRSRPWYDLRPAELSVRAVLPAVFVFIGCALLLYVGWQYLAMHREQAALEHAWAQQQQAPRTAAAPKAVATGPMLTRITIPRINLDAVVTEGTSNRALRAGPGHLRDSATPGEPGNSVIVAHRDTFFRHVYELQKGDSVEIRRGGQTYTYLVTGKRIVEPTDLSVLKQTSTPQLTLITCYPIYYIGPAPQRLIVFAKLQDQPALSSTAGKSGESHAQAQ